MIDLKTKLQNGGKIAVIGAKVSNFGDEFRKNLQIYFVSNDEVIKNGTPSLPEDIKHILTTRFMPHTTWDYYAELSRLRGIRIEMKGTGEIARILREAFPNNPVPKAPHGSVKKLVKELVDFSKSSTAEGERIYDIAAERSIPTTLASIINCIVSLRRERGLTATPKSIMSKQMVAINILNEAISGLTTIREYVEMVEKENNELKSKIRLITDVMGK